MNQPLCSLVMAAVDGPNALPTMSKSGNLLPSIRCCRGAALLAGRSQTVERPAQQRFALRHLALTDQFVSGLHRAVGPGEAARRLLLHPQLAESEVPDLLEFRLRGQAAVRIERLQDLGQEVDVRGNEQLPVGDGDRPVGQEVAFLLLVVVFFVGLGLAVVLLGRERRHVDLQLRHAGVFLLDNLPNDVAGDHPLLDRGIVLDALFDGLGHGGFVLGLDGPQQPLAGRRDRQIVVGDHGDPLPEVGDELLAKIDLRTAGIGCHALEESAARAPFSPMISSYKGPKLSKALRIST